MVVSTLCSNFIFQTMLIKNVGFLGVDDVETILGFLTEWEICYIATFR